MTLDTGSSDLWIPAAQSPNCREDLCDGGSFDSSLSSTFRVVAEDGFNITYAGPYDSDAGNWVADDISVAGGLQLQDTQFGLAMEGYDKHGVLGVGYDTNEAYSPEGRYSSIMDQMVNQGLIQRKAYSLYLGRWQEPTGSLIFGGIDSTKYSGDLVALPLQPNPIGGISEFFVTLTSVGFTDGTGQSIQLSPQGYSQAVLLDTGTTASLLSNDILEPLINGLGAVIFDQYGDMVVPCRLGKSNTTINYEFGGSPGIVIRVPLSEAIGMTIMNSKAYSDSSGGCEFSFGATTQGVSILGDSFLRSAYAVFDIDNDMVALAQANINKPRTSSISVMTPGTTIPGVSKTLIASGTQFSESGATNLWQAPIASVSDGVVIGRTPTFKLGGQSKTSSPVSVASGKMGGIDDCKTVLLLTLSVWYSTNFQWAHVF